MQGNHWITFPNAQNLRLQVSIYDSLHGLDKNKNAKIRYPISKEESICQIMKTCKDVMVLIDVQKQGRRK